MTTDEQAMIDRFAANVAEERQGRVQRTPSTPGQLDRDRAYERIAKERKRDMPESLIQQECMKLLQEDGWRTLRTDPVSNRAKGKGFGEIGMADSLAIRYSPPIGASYGGYLADASVLWCEWKALGGKPSKAQIAWHQKERSRGALTVIAGQDFDASVEGFKCWYRNSGLARNAQWCQQERR